MSGTTRDVTLRELLEVTAYYDDSDTFRWFTLDDKMTLRVTFGEVRRACFDVEGKG